MRRRLRLRRSADFVQLRRRGKRWHHPLILLIVGPNDLEHSQFGFSVSRHFGKATDRNRMKRILREVVRSRLEQIESGWDCLFVARPRGKGATYSELNAAVGQLLERSGALISSSNTLVSNASDERWK